MKYPNLEEAIKNMELLINNGAWEKRQTHKSLMPKFYEELYEFDEAVNEDNPHEIKKELADLLLQILFHSQIAKNNTEFTLEDVAAAFNEKIEKRSPEILNGESISENQQVKLWEDRKLNENTKNNDFFKLNNHAPPAENLKKMWQKYSKKEILNSEDLLKFKELEEKMLKIKLKSDDLNHELFDFNETILNRKL